MTLYLRDLDARSARPVLGDRWATELCGRIDYDFGIYHRLRSDTLTIATRARCLDLWSEEFLAAHPRGQVLHLGCGLDSRPFRVSRPATARWVDVDLPEVIDLRRRLYELPADLECLSTSVTDPGWWEHVADDRPTLAVAEGLLMYLDPADVRILIDRLLKRSRSGQLAFDAMAPWLVAVSNATQQISSVRARIRWSFREREFRAHHPALHTLDHLRVTRLAADAATRPLPRAGLRLADTTPLLRDAMRLHRFSF